MSSKIFIFFSSFSSLVGSLKFLSFLSLFVFHNFIYNKRSCLGWFLYFMWRSETSIFKGCQKWEKFSFLSFRCCFEKRFAASNSAGTYPPGLGQDHLWNRIVKKSLIFCFKKKLWASVDLNFCVSLNFYLTLVISDHRFFLIFFFWS